MKQFVEFYFFNIIYQSSTFIRFTRVFIDCKMSKLKHPHTPNRVRPRFFDQGGHETMYASSENKHFFTKSCHLQTYQNYEQSRQILGTILENKVS